MIPKKIHQVWFGEVPAVIQKYMDGWKRCADMFGWEYTCYTPDLLRAFPWKDSVRSLFNRIDVLETRSNLVRYEMLNAYGGVYVDGDIEWIEPKDPSQYIPMDSQLPVLTLDWREVKLYTQTWKPEPFSEAYQLIGFHPCMFATPPHTEYFTRVVNMVAEHWDKNEGLPHWIKGGMGLLSSCLSGPVTVVPNFRWIIGSDSLGCNRCNWKDLLTEEERKKRKDIVKEAKAFKL